MFRIRRIHVEILPVNQEAVRQVQEIFRAQFPLANAGDAEKLSEQLQKPLESGLQTLLYVAENSTQKVMGFALVLYDQQLKFCYLDYLASSKGAIGRGIGGALYERARQDAVALRATV